ncbi:hypothetical protein [Bailinhaonella thermotolerans]|uniref:Uncharacterized protein n=1 Tax=Bailinhaonella thermotolerans TaxID=1070861 RepID=A0A3A4A621_9ACTN|nr:hypothetical protein [Bailinhaonella thermotolerans]RJL21047.1 hypothetical protein D5H75_38180 [Bailinhaonella thermotolerans]
MEIDDEVVADFVGAFDAQPADALAASLTCTELDILARLFRAMGRPDLAEVWTECHADQDDQGDAHYIGGGQDGEEGDRAPQ